MPINNKVVYDNLLDTSYNNNALEQQFFNIENKYNVYINLNDIVGIAYADAELKRIFDRYYYHNNCFCNYLKKNKTFKLCTTKKQRLRDYCIEHKKPFYGRCYIGVEELVYPIFLEKKLIGYICIGEFCDDIEKTKRIIELYSRKYNINYDILMIKFNKTIRKLDFPIEELTHDLKLVSELISMKYRCYIQNKIINGNSQQVDVEENNFYINNTIKFINDNYNRNINLDMIASHSYCNASYLSHIFKKQTSYNIVDFINKIRIEKAESLLNVTNLSITEIALKVGFNNSSYFSQVFKQKNNISPLKYRKL